MYHKEEEGEKKRDVYACIGDDRVCMFVCP